MLRELSGQLKVVMVTMLQQRAGVSNAAEVDFRGLGPGLRRTARTDNMKFQQNIAVLCMCVSIQAVLFNDVGAARGSCLIVETVLNLELRARTPMKAEPHKHMIKSVLMIDKETHDKFCGLKLIFNVVCMVFNIITSIIKFNTIKVNIKTYLDSNYSSK